jgi:hypothetical protein
MGIGYLLWRAGTVDRARGQAQWAISGRVSAAVANLTGRLDDARELRGADGEYRGARAGSEAVEVGVRVDCQRRLKFRIAVSCRTSSAKSALARRVM